MRTIFEPSTTTAALVRMPPLPSITRAALMTIGCWAKAPAGATLIAASTSVASFMTSLPTQDSAYSATARFRRGRHETLQAHVGHDVAVVLEGVLRVERQNSQA